MTVIVIFFLRVGEIVRCRRSCSRCHTFKHTAPRRVHQKLLPPLARGFNPLCIRLECRSLLPVSANYNSNHVLRSQRDTAFRPTATESVPHRSFRALL